MKGNSVLQPLCISLLIVGAVACGRPDPRQGSAVGFARGDYAFVGVNVIPMTVDRLVLRDQTVVVRDGRIEAIGGPEEVSLPAGAHQIEATGHYLIPGLMDLHVHLEHFRSPEVLKLFVANGVTSVRNMDGRPYILHWRDSVRAGVMIGPTILTAGPILDGDPPLLDDNTSIRDADDARAAVREQAEAGYDFIKVYTGLSAEAYRAVLVAAGEEGLRVAGHVPSRIPVTEVFEGGQESIEHLDGYDELIESEESPYRDSWHWSKLYLAVPVDTARIREAAALTARSNVWNVPTLVQAEKVAASDEMRGWLSGPTMAYMPPNVLHQWAPENRDPMSRRLLEEFGDEERRILERGLQNRSRMVRALHEAGAGVLVGTDTPNPFVVPGFAVHEELANFVESGLDPAAALAAATREASRFLGLLDEVGIVQEGRRADLLLLRKNPLEAIENTSEIAGVMAGGVWRSSEDLQILLEEVAATYE